jgi:RimJ/RimL family protein N-acetyltransferase
MSTQMTDPHQGMISFQQGLRAGILDLDLVLPHQDLYSHFDVPLPGVARLTYVRLSEDRLTVKAFLSCVMNGKVEGFPCVALGYAVPEDLRNQGFAKQILKDVIRDQILQARRAGHAAVYFEAVVDVTNTPSQRVAEAVLAVEREEIIDTASQRPAYRYTKRFDSTAS